jgi:cell division septation protein DedD
MAGFAGGLWYAYAHLGSRSPADAPLIRADDKAMKIRPEQPGGMAIHDLDKRVYDMGRAPPQVEKLLPPPETPLPRPVAPPAAPSAEAGAAAEASTPGPVDTPPPVTAAPPQVAAAPPPVIAAPSTPPPLAAPQAAAPPPVAEPPAIAAPAAPPAAQTAAPPPKAAASAPPAPHPAAASGGYRLQLAALHSADAAKQAWDRLKQANKDLLGRYNAIWPRADLGERGVYYRVQAGPIADGAAAERLCGELRHRNIGCILVKP